MTPLSLGAYARHRKAAGLPGGTLHAVQVARDDGRLSSSINRDGKIISTELADAEWAASTKADHVPLTGPTSPVVTAPPVSNGLAEARARREAAQATIREMELAERQGELVSAKDVEKQITSMVTQCRTRLLSLPARARQRDASLTTAHLALFETLLREALEDLVEPHEETNATAAG